MRSKGENVAYYADGKGRWLRREWECQCPHRVFIYGRCQGVEGHNGVHWCYGPCGSFQWADNKDDPQHDGSAGSTPPGHKDYVSPARMQRRYFMSNFTDTEVLDQGAITSLEKNKPPEPGASIDRPLVLSQVPRAIRRRIQNSMAARRKATSKRSR